MKAGNLVRGIAVSLLTLGEILTSASDVDIQPVLNNEKAIVSKPGVISAPSLDEVVKYAEFPKNWSKPELYKYDLEILSYTKVPSVIIESLFVSNKEDVRYFLNEDNQKSFVHNIAVGLNEFAKKHNIDNIIIGGGHGEYDSGASSDTVVEGKKIDERYFAKRLSKLLAEELKENYNVELIWYDPGKLINGYQKKRIAHHRKIVNSYSKKDDQGTYLHPNTLYVEFHADAGDKTRSGCSVIISPNNNYGIQPLRKDLANTIQNYLPKNGKDL